MKDSAPSASSSLSEPKGLRPKTAKEILNKVTAVMDNRTGYQGDLTLSLFRYGRISGTITCGNPAHSVITCRYRIATGGLEKGKEGGRGGGRGGGKGGREGEEERREGEKERGREEGKDGGTVQNTLICVHIPAR